MKARIKSADTVAPVPAPKPKITTNDLTFALAKAPRSAPLTATEHANRETYLERAVEEIRPWFKAKGGTDIPDVRVACGFPGGRGGKKVLGACWDAKSADDKKANIFISPFVDETFTVLHVLVHELVHACVGYDEGHGAGFKRLARAVGLRGRATSTTAGVDLSNFLNDLIERIGKYPHAKLNLTDNPVKKQTTRMIKLVCPKSGYVARTTRQWLKAHGPLISPVTKAPMNVESDVIDDEDEDQESPAGQKPADPSAN